MSSQLPSRPWLSPASNHGRAHSCVLGVHRGFAAATRIQACFRRHSARTKYTRLRDTATLVSAHWKRVRQRRWYYRLHSWMWGMGAGGGGLSAASSAPVSISLKQHTAFFWKRAVLIALLRARVLGSCLRRASHCAYGLSAACLCVPCSFLVKRAAVTRIAASVKRHAARQRFLVNQAAATALAAAWRGRRSRLLFHRQVGAVHCRTPYSCTLAHSTRAQQ